MSESKHTPGPWTAGDRHLTERFGARTYVPVLRPGSDPVPVAVVHRDVDGFGREQGDANARLIAAAPDQNAALLAAPRPFTAIEDADKLSAFIIEYADWFFKVRHPAIAKAAGNGEPTT